MFDNCISLLDITPLSNWDVSGIESMNKMFYSCESIMDISSLESWKLADGVSIIGIFDDCFALKEYPKWFKIEVIRNDKFEPESRRKVIEELDEGFFRDYDLNNFNEPTQMFMVSSLTDESLLAYILDRSSYRPVQEFALDKINDEEILTSIAIHDHNYDIIQSRKGGMDLKFFFYNREKAFLKIKNKVFLIKIAKEMQHKFHSIEYLTEYVDTEESWIDIALNAQSYDVRLFAFGKIEAENSLQRIVDESKDEVIVDIAQKTIKAIEDARRQKEEEEAKQKQAEKQREIKEQKRKQAEKDKEEIKQKLAEKHKKESEDDSKNDKD